ncbi:MAG: tubulin-like doman-containing protein [Acidobacteriota bacterium]|nr:tubulin-like doman-containing protein [Acidobacteriota bacterium]
MSKKNPQFKPALLIGAGGTGVKVLRYVKSLAEEGIEPQLKKMMDCNYLSMVALDTDHKSNDKEQAVDTNMANHSCENGESAERLPSKLHLIDETWVHLDRRPLNRAVSTLNRYQSANSLEDTEDFPLKTISKWFPKKLPNGDSITLGHSKLSGAAQWRPLGRLAFFLNASRIYNALFTELNNVSQSAPENETVNAYIICSLAGGTGGGIFWDLAFFLQMIAPGTKTSGLFLLGDPFESVDEAGRIFPNIYGALKEIYYYKNWQREFRVDYPIGDGKFFDSAKNGLIPFDITYLFQSFPPGFGVADRSSATIDYTCFRMAHNLLSHIRHDIHRVLDVGANNIDSDTTSMASQPKKGFCYSTSASVSFPLHDVAHMGPYFKCELVRHYQNQINTRLEAAPKAIEKDQFPEKSVPTFQSWQDHFFKEHQGLLPGMKDLLEKIDYTLARLRSMPDANPYNLIHKNVGQRLRTAIETIDLEHETLELEGVWGRVEKVISQAAKELSTAWEKEKATLVGETEILEDEYLKMFEGWLSHLQEAPIDEMLSTTSCRIPMPAGSHSFLDPLRKDAAAGQADEDGTASGAEDDQQAGFAHKLADKTGKPVRLQIRKRSQWVIDQDRIQRAYHAISKTFLESLKQRLATQVYDRGAAEITYLLACAWNEQRRQFLENCRELIEKKKTDLEKHKRDIQRYEQFKRTLTEYLTGNQEEKPENFQVFLGQMAPSAEMRRNDWFRPRATQLLNRLAKNLKYDFSDHEKLQIPDLDLDLDEMISRLKKLCRQLEEHSNFGTTDYNKDYFQEFLKDCVFKEDIANVEDGPAFIKRLEIIVDSIVDYWSAYAHNIMMQAGGEDAFLERLYRCRPNIFAGGVRENSINKKHLVLFPFTGEMSDEDHKEFENLFKRISQRVFHVGPTIVAEPTRTPIIYYEDLFRGADEIARIEDYYHAYEHENRLRKAFFHIHPDASDFPEIIKEPSAAHISCGNPGCDNNIKHEDRTLKICPGCKNPIWNRCGNSECPADNLRELIFSESAGNECGHKNYIPHNCPKCRRKLLNWWWVCEEKDHNRPNPMDKISCTTCVKEYHEGKRNLDDIRRRPDSRDFNCHGCESKPGHCCPVKVPASLKRFYLEGVNGHDGILFAELIARCRQNGYEIGHYQCEKGYYRHFIFPTCPEGRNQENKRHHLYKTQKGVWSCTDHTLLEFSTCGECGYPICLDFDKAGCPRCLKKVRDCFYCTEKTGSHRLPVEGSDPERCSYCFNLMNGFESDFLLPDITANLKEPAICPNIFHCKAAAHPHETSSKHDLGHCKVCEEAVLLPRHYFLHELDRCPFCRISFGRNSHSGIRKIDEDPFDVIRYCMEVLCKTIKDERPIARCVICGIHPIDFTSWFINTHLAEDWKDLKPPYKESLEPKKDEFLRWVAELNPGIEEYALEVLHFTGDTALEHYRKKTLPEIDWNVGMKIFKTLLQKREDVDAALHLNKLFSPPDKREPSVVEDLMKLFVPKSAVYRIVSKRLVGLLRELRKFSSDRSDWSGQGTDIYQSRASYDKTTPDNDGDQKKPKEDGA